MQVNDPPSGELIPSVNGGPAPIVVSGWSNGEYETSSRSIPANSVVGTEMKTSPIVALPLGSSRTTAVQSAGPDGIVTESISGPTSHVPTGHAWMSSGEP